jgi:transposase
MARESREVWSERVARWIESGQSAPEFGEAIGVNVWTLRKWRQRFSEEERCAAQSLEPGSIARVGRRRAAVPRPPLAFVELLTNAVPPPEALAVPLELVLDRGRSVRIRTGFDPQTLERLLAVLEVR